MQTHLIFLSMQEQYIQSFIDISLAIAANMVKWGIRRSSACLCGEIHIGDHVLKCHTIGPPCPLQNVENPCLINYLTLWNFWSLTHLILCYRLCYCCSVCCCC